MWQPSGAQEIKNDFLDDLFLCARANGVADPPVQPGTDWDALATAVANCQLLQYANSRIAEDNTDVNTAQGEKLEQKRKEFGVPPQNPLPSSGKIQVRVNGSGTIPAGRQLTLPNGLRLQTVSLATVLDKDEIDVIAIDVGTGTNAKAGTKVQFISAPLNVQQEATVSTKFPLTGGLDVESDPAKRKRILDRLKYQPDGANWGALREKAKGALGSIRDAFVHPALGGPASVKVVIVKKTDPAALDFSQVPTDGQVNIVRAAVQASNSSADQIIVQAVAEQALDMVLIMSLPDSSLAGGNGLGWLDQNPWPQLENLDENRVTVSAVDGASNGTKITVTAQTAVSPVVGQTRIAWWSPQDLQFRIFTVTAVTGSAGAWVITLDKPLIDSTGALVQVGNYISPPSERLKDYGTEWLAQMSTLGPGENTADAARLPRSLRHPYVTVESASYPAFAQLDGIKAKFPEIVTIGYGQFLLVPTVAFLDPPDVPASVDTAPSIFAIRNFGIYKF
jgi:uncharacterized phage protein gp47/JayE